MRSRSITGQKHWNSKSEFEFFLLLDLVLSWTLALFGTPVPQFVNVRLTDGQVGEVGQVGHTAEKQDSCERTKIFFPPLSSDSFYVCLQIRILKLSESVCVLVFFLSCFNLLKNVTLLNVVTWFFFCGDSLWKSGWCLARWTAGCRPQIFSPANRCLLKALGAVFT